MKKLWSWKDLLDGTIVLTSYKGCEDTVVVPCKIGNKKVAEIGQHAFAVRENDGHMRPYANNRKNIKKVVIENGVKKIGFAAFWECVGLEEIIIPNSIKTIENSAFGYTGLKSLTIPAKVKEVGAICGKSKVETVIISEGVLSLDSSFEGCYQLKSVSLPSTLVNVSSDTFKGCNALENISVVENKSCYLRDGILFHEKDGEERAIAKENSITDIPKGITVLTNTFFYETDVEEYVIPQGVQIIGREAFKNCKRLSKITIPDTVTKIELDAFYACEALTEIDLPDSIVEIEGRAFYGCQRLEKVKLPKNIQNVGFYLFAYCSGLKKVDFLPEKLEMLPNGMFAECGKLEELIIPPSVEEIDSNVLENTEIPFLEIPESVTTLKYEAFKRSFIKKLVIPESVKFMEGNIFYGCPTMSIKICFRGFGPQKRLEQIVE